MKDFSQFEQNLNLNFKNKDLLREAFTHRSYINESKRNDLTHNERLEFLGDAVLELVVTDFLFKKYPDRTEGDLTSYRSALVNAVTLGEVAHTLGMNDYLLLSKGEAKDTGRARNIILANTLESIIGAIYLDRGYRESKKFILKFVTPGTDDIIRTKTWLDAKSLFQEKAQEITSFTPVYKVLKEVGPDHDKRFTSGVFLGEKKIAEGEGESKQDAEQIAAKNALKEKNW